MLAKISQTGFSAKEVKYHRWCRAKYRTETESIFQSKNSKHQMMQALHIAKFTMNGIRKEKSTLKLLMLSAILLRFKLL